MSALEGLQWSFSVRGIGWPLLSLWEFPVWLGWWAVSPAVFAFSRRFPLAERQWPRHLPMHAVFLVLLGATYLAGTSLARNGLAVLLSKSGMDWSPQQLRFLAANSEVVVLQVLRGFFVVPILLYCATVALQHAVAYRRAFNARQLDQVELEKVLAQSQLDALKLQLQPHFLFNTLNTIALLISRDPPGARRVLSQLAELLRQVLRDGQRHEWTLREELSFLKGYIAIQKARFRDNLEVSIAGDVGLEDQMVPRMLLQPLVENAIQYAFTTGRCHVTVQAGRVGSSLLLEVLDNGAGFEPGMKEGIGLRNTRQRLVSLYGTSASLLAQNAPGGGAIVQVRVPARVRDLPAISKMHTAS